MEKTRPIYLDYMATTPVDERVIEAMVPFLGFSGIYGNALSSTHTYGKDAALAIDKARLQVATTVGASAEAIIFTSGATESNNLAILGATEFYARKGKHIITMTTEHHSVIECFKLLEKQGYEVTYLDPKSDGLLDLEAFKSAIREDTIFVSIMHVNNEIGIIQDIAAIGELLKGRGILFHVDAAQSVGRVQLNLEELPVDLMSFSAHKSYGPKGIGALFMRQKPRIRLVPRSFGGGQEGGLRAGTLPTHQIVGMGEAFEIAENMRGAEEERLLGLRNQILEAIKSTPQIRVNGSLTERVAGNLNLCFEGIENTEVLVKLHALALSTASACASKKHAGSDVLRAMGLSDADVQSSVRMSLGRYTTDEDMKHVIAGISSVY